MGVYSTAAAEMYRSQMMLENFKFSDLLEFAVNAERNNQNMFNTLIELDFKEAVENMNGSYLTEGEKFDNFKAKAVEIGKKIIEAIKKFMDTIGTAIKKFIIKCQEFFKVNKRLTDQIGDLDTAKLTAIYNKNKDKIGDIEFTKFVGDKEQFTKPLADINAHRIETTSAIYSYINDHEALFDKFKERVDDLKHQKYTLDDETVSKMFTTVKIGEMVKDSYITGIKARLVGGFDAMVKDFTKTIEDTKKICNDIIKKTKEDMKNAEKKSDQATMLNIKYKYYNAANAQYCKLLSQAISIVVKWMTADRATYAKLGSLSKKYVAESALFECMAIDMVNNNYMTELFA